MQFISYLLLHNNITTNLVAKNNTHLLSHTFCDNQGTAQQDPLLQGLLQPTVMLLARIGISFQAQKGRICFHAHAFVGKIGFLSAFCFFWAIGKGHHVDLSIGQPTTWQLGSQSQYGRECTSKTKVTVLNNITIEGSSHHLYWILLAKGYRVHPHWRGEITQGYEYEYGIMETILEFLHYRQKLEKCLASFKGYFKTIITIQRRHGYPTGKCSH